MAEERSFWKRAELPIVILATLLFIYLLVFFNQKINFLLGNELIVSLVPQQKSFSMHYGDVARAEFETSIDNAAYCRAACSYSFSDLGTNMQIDNGSFEIARGQNFTRSYNLSVNKLGSGQDLYNFDVECSSIRSFFCLTKSQTKSRSSLVIVNYDLTETEKQLKNLLKQNVTNLLTSLSEVDNLHQELNQKYFQLGFKVDLRNLSKEKIAIDDTLDKTRISSENLRSLWSTEDYVRLSRLFNGSYFEVLDDIKSSIGDLNKSIGSIVELHNELLDGLGRLSAKLRQLESFANEIGNNEITGQLNAAIGNFNRLASSLTNNTFENYDSFIAEFGNAVGNETAAIEESRIPATRLFIKSDYFLSYENDLLCSLKQDCGEDFSLNKTISETEAFAREYPNLTLAIQNCGSLNLLEQKFADIKNKTSEMIADENASFPQSAEFLSLANNFMDNAARKINNSYFDSFERIKSENRSNIDILNLAAAMLPASRKDLTPLSYDQSLNISLYLLSKISVPQQAYDLSSQCAKLSYETEKVGSFDFRPINASITYNVTSEIETNLSDNPPICCVFNDCKPCCRDESCKNDPKTFPVIFLHGHSFAKDNSPEFSLDSFNSLQSKLQDDGYLNAGIVSLYSQDEQSQGIWGLSGKPVSVKVSYYYDAFRKEDKYIAIPTKSENIDNYALRLKDLIEIVKQRTGKPKVNIIAHSMGGLVARRYVQIFGENDIDKLVMIATPNSGISSEISDYCGYVGENRECDDMKENSLFMNKLNDPMRQPAKAKLYSIIGQGCQMRTGDGDGVVSVENAKLENAKLYYINGTCGGLFGERLHTEILNIQKYPDTYNIIREILKG